MQYNRPCKYSRPWLNSLKSTRRKFFSFNHIMCLYILLVSCGALKSANFPHANAQMPCCNRIKSIVTAAMCMSLLTGALLDDTQHTLSAVFLASYTSKIKNCKALYTLWFNLRFSGDW